MNTGIADASPSTTMTPKNLEWHTQRVYHALYVCSSVCVCERENLSNVDSWTVFGHLAHTAEIHIHWSTSFSHKRNSIRIFAVRIFPVSKNVEQSHRLKTEMWTHFEWNNENIINWRLLFVRAVVWSVWTRIFWNFFRFWLWRLCDVVHQLKWLTNSVTLPSRLPQLFA